jgi:hypothetical protein
MRFKYPEVVAEYGLLREQLERTLRALNENVDDHELYDAFGKFNQRTAYGAMAAQIHSMLQHLQILGY